jgi:hypothetical protein
VRRTIAVVTANETKWSAIVAEYRASGQTATEFSLDRQVSVHSLRYWSHRFKAPQPEPPKDVRLARLVRDDGSRDAEIVIERSGIRVHVGAGFNRATLRAVLEVLAEIGNAAT